MIPMEALSRAIQLVPPLVVLGFMEEFHVQAGPYRAAGGAEAELGYAVPYKK